MQKKLKINLQPLLYRTTFENFEDDVRESIVVCSESDSDSEEKQEVKVRRGQVTDVALVSLLLTLNIFDIFS